MLSDRGFTSVFALKGGWRLWDDNGYPTEAK
jgi:3-mercaptopyruvate sulfurtransferase SseA